MPDARQMLVDDLRGMSSRQFAAWLLAPARSGFYLSAQDLQRLGRHLGVSVQPFSREAALDQFLRGAALDDRLGSALDLLQAEMTTHLAEYRRIDVRQLDVWISRAGVSLDGWQELRIDLDTEDIQSPSPAE